MKKIALIGNMNNNFYALTRYLRDAGYDAHLFYRMAMEHFQPKADCYEEVDESYCHKVNWLDHGFHNIDIQAVRNQLRDFSFYIGQGEEAAAAFYAGFNIDVYYPYGSDVYKYAHLPYEYKLKSKLASLFVSNSMRPTWSQMKRGTMAKYLGGAIKNARYIFADTTNAEYQERIEKLEYRGLFQNVGLPLIYAKDYEKLLNGFAPEFSHRHRADELRRTHDFILLYHGRQEWQTYHNAFTVKHTDYLIRGFAKYKHENSKAKACLVMLEYGTDVDASKNLVNTLGIEDAVFWFPKMYRKELMYLIRLSDVCCGEFAHSFLVFGTVIEAMLMKKPVITFRDDKLYSTYKELYPCYNSQTPIEICESIKAAINNPQERLMMGERANDWIKEYLLRRPFEKLLEVIEQ